MIFNIFTDGPVDPLIWLYSLIVIGAALVLGTGFLFYTGFVRVKKGKVAIVERVGLFIEVLYKTRYFAPIKYRRVAYYSLAPVKVKCKLPNGKLAIITLQITNVILFHYSRVTYEQHLDTIYNSNEQISLDILKGGFSDIGIRLYNIEEFVEPMRK